MLLSKRDSLLNHTDCKLSFPSNRFLNSLLRKDLLNIFLDHPYLKDILQRKFLAKYSRRENQETTFSKYCDELANKRGTSLQDRFPVKANVDEIFSQTKQQFIRQNILQHRAKQVLAPIAHDFHEKVSPEKSPSQKQNTKTSSPEPRRVLFRGGLPAISKEKPVASTSDTYQKIMSNMVSNAIILEELTKNTKQTPTIQVFANTNPIFQDQLQKRKRRFELQKEKELRRDLKQGVPTQSTEVFTINVQSRLLRKVNYSPRKHNLSFDEPRINVRGYSEDMTNRSFQRYGTNSSRHNVSFI